MLPIIVFILVFHVPKILSIRKDSTTLRVEGLRGGGVEGGGVRSGGVEGWRGGGVRVSTYLITL